MLALGYKIEWLIGQNLSVNNRRKWFSNLKDFCCVFRDPMPQRPSSLLNLLGCLSSQTFNICSFTDTTGSFSSFEQRSMTCYFKYFSVPYNMDHILWPYDMNHIVNLLNTLESTSPAQHSSSSRIEPYKFSASVKFLYVIPFGPENEITLWK